MPIRGFESLYNVEISAFVDVRPYMYEGRDQFDSDKFKSTSVNMPTYNYGYPNKRSEVDVEPSKKLGQV